MRVILEEHDAGTCNIEGASGDEQDIPAGPSSSSRSRHQKYHRHTSYQIQELEASFKDNPHPDEKERLALGKKGIWKTSKSSFGFRTEEDK
ncbi:putative transcription factor homeobox-WOX family [Helianthus anomalus]